MYTSPSRPVALMFLLALALPAIVVAQDKDTADVTGVVLDASGRPVAGYPMKISTPQWGDVVMHPTEDNGSFAVSGLPPGSYELRVFDPGASPEKQIASKQITLAAGQAEKIEIRLASDGTEAAAASKSASGRPASGTFSTTGVYLKAVLIAALVIGAGLVAFVVLRNQRRPA